MPPDSPDADRRACFQAWDALRRPIWIFDPYGLSGVYANPAALKLWGAQSLRELLDRDFSQMSPAAQARTKRLAQATAGGDDIEERWTFYPNGAPVTVRATISTLLHEGRQVLLFEASAVEVDAEERRAVEALRHTSTMITLFDEQGRAIFSNPAAFLAYGLGAVAFHARFADPTRAAALFGTASGGEIVSEVCELVTAEGCRWHHLDVRKVADPVTGAVAMLLNEVDVTRRVEAEQARAAAEQKASMAEARQRFLSDMSHELRTPLNAVIGFSALLKASDLTPEQIDHAARIHRAGGQLSDVVNEMIRLGDLDEWAGERDEGSSAPPAPIDAAPTGPGLAKPTAPRVLYVDDNASNRALVTAILRAQGIECEVAEDGAQGLGAAGSAEWDLILMDIQMPVMDGVQAARAIRGLPHPAGAVPILAVTANTLPNELEIYADAGMNDCIAKPIDMAALLSQVIYWTAPVDDQPAA